MHLSPFMSELENTKAPLKCYSDLSQSRLLVTVGVSSHSTTRQDFWVPPGVAETLVE